MSSKATTWAWQQIGIVRGSTHHLLLAIAENANWESGLAYPSIACLIAMTGQDRKTIIAGIDKILEAKLMKDTGARTGRTRQIPVYRMAPWVTDWAQSEEVGKTGLFNFDQGKGAVSPTEESRISGEESQKRDTEPSIEPSRESNPPSPDGEGTPEGELFGQLPAQPEPPPLEEMVEASWAALKEAHPGVGRLDLMTPKRVKAIHARAGEIVRIMAKKKRVMTPADVWEEIFRRIPKSDFLCGRAPPGKGRRDPFKLRIDYVLRPTEFTAIFEGAYDDGERSGPGRSYDPGTGRQYGPAAAAARRAIERHVAPSQRRA